MDQQNFSMNDTEPGTPMIDVITILHSIHILSNGAMVSKFHLGSLANFLETIVLFDKVYVDAKGYEKSTSKFTHRSISSLLGSDITSAIQPLESSKFEKSNAFEYAEQMIHSPIFSSLLNDWARLYPDIRLMDVLHDMQHFDKISALHDSFPELKHRPMLGDVNTAAGFGSAIRAWHYMALAAERNIPYIPNDFRALFVDYLLKKTSAMTIMEETENTFEQKLKNGYEWFGNHYIKHARFPLISNYIFSKAKGLDDIISVATKLRNSELAKNFREACKELDMARINNDGVLQFKAIEKLEKEIGKIQKSINAPLFTIGLSFPPSISFRVGSDILKNYVAGRQFVFIRKIFEGSVFTNQDQAFKKLLSRKN